MSVKVEPDGNTENENQNEVTVEEQPDGVKTEVTKTETEVDYRKLYEDEKSNRVSAETKLNERLILSRKNERLAKNLKAQLAAAGHSFNDDDGDSDADKEDSEIVNTLSENQKLKITNAKNALVIEKGFPKELLPALKGSTAEEINSHAETLLTFFNASKADDENKKDKQVVVNPLQGIDEDKPTPGEFDDIIQAFLNN